MSRELTRRQNNESTLMDEESVMAPISQRGAQEEGGEEQRERAKERKIPARSEVRRAASHKVTVTEQQRGSRGQKRESRRLRRAK